MEQTVSQVQSWEEAYAALRTSAAVIDRGDRGVVRVDGADRRSFLQGLLTNDIAALTPGAACYAALLTPQGRMIADMNVVELGEYVLLDVDRERAADLAARLDRSIFSEDVAVRDASAEYGRAAVAGPDGPRAVDHARAAEPGVVSFVDRAWDVPLIELFVGAANLPALRNVLAAAGASDADPRAVEALRIESGVPRFGLDMDEHTIPLEAGIEERAISFTKGCYVGQEVIIRVLHRGHGRVAKKLVRLTIDAASARELPAPGAPLTVSGKDVGRLTSVAWSPAQHRGVALGYVQREAAAAATKLDGGIIVA